MRGLFYKDIKNIRVAVVVSIVIMFLETLLYKDMFYDEKIEYLVMITSWIIVLCGAAIPTLLISDDDRNGFLKYLKVLPVNKYKVIGEKYIIAFALIVIFSTIGIYNIYMTDEMSTDNLWWIIFITFPIALVVNSIIHFCIVTFGTEKALGVSLITFLVLITVITVVTGFIGSNYRIEDVVCSYKVHILISGLIASVIMYFATVKCYIYKEY